MAATLSVWAVFFAAVVVPVRAQDLIIAIGLVRIWEAVMSAIVSALGSTRELSLLNMLNWLAIALSTVCAASAASFGLLGVVCALGAGWCVLAPGASALAARAWSRLS